MPKTITLEIQVRKPNITQEELEQYHAKYR